MTNLENLQSMSKEDLAQFFVDQLDGRAKDTLQELENMLVDLLPSQESVEAVKNIFGTLKLCMTKGKEEGKQVWIEWLGNEVMWLDDEVK